MLNKELIQKQFQGLGQDDALKVLAEQYQIYFNHYSPVKTFWFAKVFTSCSAQDLEYQINEFLWFINIIVAPVTRTCFNEESTVSLGETGCGRQTTILYFTLSRSHD